MLSQYNEENLRGAAPDYGPTPFQIAEELQWESVIQKGGVDSHIHLCSMLDNLDSVRVRAMNVGISELVCSITPYEWEKYRNRFNLYPNIYFTLGVYPGSELTDLDKCRIFDIATEDLLGDKRIVALGEIGLDAGRHNMDEQEKVFRQQLYYAKFMRKPVVIHARDAFKKCYDILVEHGFGDSEVLWHCFTEDKQCMKMIMDKGWYCSISGIVTYKSASKLRDAVKSVRSDRLVLETDAPWLSPNSKKGTKNESSFMLETCEKVTNILGGMTSSVLLRMCGDNSRRFYNIG